MKANKLINLEIWSGEGEEGSREERGHSVIQPSKKRKKLEGHDLIIKNTLSQDSIVGNLFEYRKVFIHLMLVFSFPLTADQ